MRTKKGKLNFKFTTIKEKYKKKKERERHKNLVNVV